MRSRRAALVSMTVGLVCVLIALVIPASADAGTAGVTVSVNGSPFAAASTQRLLDVAGIAPGGSATGTLGVRSGVDQQGDLHLRMHDVRDDDNGCNRTERVVDATCGNGGGDLGARLRVAISEAQSRGGRFVQRWVGTVAELEQGVALGTVVPAHGERWLRMTATIPTSAGNEIETDTFTFALSVVLAGSGGAEVGAQSSHRADSSGAGVLAATGISGALLVVGAGLLLGAGLVLLIGARHRQRT